jgi:hypothetical protein
MKPDSHEEIPVTLDEATKAKLDEPVEEVPRHAIETGLRAMETARQN